MNITKSIKSLIACLAIVGTLAVVGCATTTSVTPGVNGGPATTNVVVNQATLTTDCAFIQTGLAIATSVVVQKDPSAVPILVDATITLDGIINGASTNTTAQVLGVLGKNSNPTIVANITPIINSLSSFEQTEIKKYGVTVGGQIAVAVATAVDNGIKAGLPATK